YGPEDESLPVGREDLGETRAHVAAEDGFLSIERNTHKTPANHHLGETPRSGVCLVKQCDTKIPGHSREVLQSSALASENCIKSVWSNHLGGNPERHDLRLEEVVEVVARFRAKQLLLGGV